MELMLRRPPGRVMATLLDWVGVPFSLQTPESPLAGGEVAGVTVNATTILKISAVWACARLISETIATLPLSVYERTPSGKRIADSHRLQFVIHDQPNPDSTAALFWEAMVAAMLLRGCGRAEKLMLGERVVGLVFLDPRRLTSYWRNGVKVWRYTEESGLQREIPGSRIFSIPGFSIDGRNGASVVSYGCQVFGAALAADSAATTTWEKGLQKTTWWKYPNVLKPHQRSEAREAIEQLAGAQNSGKPVILEAGMEVGTIGIDPKDAQLLESRSFSVEEICRWFRVPPFMVGHTQTSTSWGTGIEQQMIGFLIFTLAPWLRRIEQQINKDLLLPAEKSRFYSKFAVEGLLRADSAARATFYGAMVNNGIYTRDEVRELEDREPMGGNAEVLTVQTAMAPLDSIGTEAISDAGQARNALLNWLKQE